MHCSRDAVDQQREVGHPRGAAVVGYHGLNDSDLGRRYEVGKEGCRRITAHGEVERCGWRNVEAQRRDDVHRVVARLQEPADEQRSGYRSGGHDGRGAGAGPGQRQVDRAVMRYNRRDAFGGATMDLFPFEDPSLKNWHIVAIALASVVGGLLLLWTIFAYVRDSMLNGGGREAPPPPEA